MPHRNSWLSAIGLGVFFLLASCSPVKFSANQKNQASDNNVTDTGTNPPPGGGPSGGSIGCGPTLNGGTSAVTLNSSSSNPQLEANCTPSGVAYNWTVTRGSTPVTINGLTGSSSTPDFLAAGAGSYFIGFNASAVGWTSYQLPSPLQVVVQNNDPNAPNIVCNPRINGTLTSITLTSTDPTITANCTPSNVSYVWTTLRNGIVTPVPGMSGSSATGAFIATGAGTYQIYLVASTSGHNAFVATTPLTVTVPSSGGGQNVVDNFNVTVSNDKLDILLVIDDSASMLADNQRLASRLEGFVNDLSSAGLDWQMCVTLTRAQRISTSDPNFYWGASYNWSGNPGTPRYILKKGTTGAYQIFVNTINQIGAGWAGTDDERAIKAAWWHLWNGEPGVTGSSGCYRQDAALAVIILSDEDERSIGGDETQAYYEHEKNKPLETDDLPLTYVNYVKQVFGNAKRFSVNSIIVRPGDSACLEAQDQEGSKAHYGTKYAELSQLTNGYVGNICASDYSASLNYFRDSIVNTQASVPLQCAPNGPIGVLVSPPLVYTSHVDNLRLIFNPQIPAGSTIQLTYTCP